MRGQSSALPCVLHRKLTKAIPEPKSQCPLWSHTPKHRGLRQFYIPGSSVWPSSAHGGLLLPAPLYQFVQQEEEEEEESHSQQNPSNSVPGPMQWLRLLTVAYVLFYRPCVLRTLCYDPIPLAASSLDLTMVPDLRCPMLKALRASQGYQQYRYLCPGPGA